MSENASRSPVFYLLFAGLLALGAWGLWLILDNNPRLNGTLTPAEANQTEATHPATSSHTTDSTGDKRNNQAITSDLSRAFTLIAIMLKEARFSEASDFINERYSIFSSDDLSDIRRLYQRQRVALLRARAKPQLVELHRSETAVFNDLDAWHNLSLAAINVQNWSLAFDASLQVSLLQNDGLELSKLFARLTKVAATLRASLEQQGDQLGVHQIYDRLYKAHPGHPRFQLELAHSFLRLSNTAEARPLLQQLQYDLEFGELSRDMLARLDQKQDEAVAASEPQQASPDIEIPLRRLGTNLIADIAINNQTVALLLDTGASITALDHQLISRLGLQVTGQAIRLSTANGVREARLYRARRIKLGRFLLNDHIIAGIDLDGSSQFSGLLGTDLLNNLHQDYSFVIDNQKSTLVFRPKI